ncbi:WxL domain-containing protein [Exiguobacterium antarcticum]|uniref:WxL domain-containing protein n=1 Tax=Exiguobacterium antarcticum TaxID=132920 RepID=A0ABT6R115_9BACL|nr:WxL domain-containing protein [Exiguobacterium antarcticum]MDI3234632.1 WxL domain-containing protein [Exiguobacterium antarcticum]
MKKRFAATSVLMSTALLLGTTSAFAATTSKGNSTATITFTTNEAPVIVDPETPDPQKPYDPIGDGGNNPTGNTGPLTLDYAPNFNFGSHESRATNSAVYQALDKKPFLQVTDRRAKRSKWDVKVKLGKFKSSQTSEDSLTGAKLSIENGIVKSAIDLIDVPAPTTQDVVLEAGAADGTSILSSADGTFSTWLVYWPGDLVGQGSNTRVSLNVPINTQVEGTHTATLEWVLSDVVN